MLPLTILGLGGVRVPILFLLWPFPNSKWEKSRLFNKLKREFAQIYTNTFQGPNRVK